MQERSGCRGRGGAEEGGYLTAFLPHDTNADIGRLDHGYIVGTISNAKHLAAQPALLPFHIPPQSL